MAALVRDAAHQPIVREAALPLVGGPWSTDTAQLLEAIDQFVRANMTLVDEPEELIQRPEWLVAQIRSRQPVYGDCDDATVLGLSLASALGVPCRIVAIRRAEDPEYSHVFGECLVTDRQRGMMGWQRLDPTIARGRWIAGPMESMVVPV
jgi:transglutaminase-like putative cysteine protease